VSEPYLVVAVCAGARCRALRQLHDPSAASAGPPGQELRDAVRARQRAVLITTGCLGACHQGCVVAVGHGTTEAVGTAGAGHLIWAAPPVGLGLAELPDRSRELAGWVRDGAPDVAMLPGRFRRPGAA
jgi:hypothetical protein